MAATGSATPLQLLFVIDATEATGASFSLLNRACLAIVQACVRAPLRIGLLTVRARGHESLCTPSGFTSDSMQARRWLRSVLFDGGAGTAAHLEGLLAAAAGDWWEAGAQRHAVLVTHSEPHPLPASYASPLAEGDAASSLPVSLWSPVPEVLAKAGVSLSVVAPRPMPRLSRLYAAVFLTAQRLAAAEAGPNAAKLRADPAVPRPTRFSEAPELFVLSSLLPDSGTSAAAGANLMSSPSAMAGPGEAPWGAPPSKRRKAGSPGGRASPIFHVEGATSGPPLELWSGSLAVQLPTGTVDLGATVLRGEGPATEAARWRGEALARWGSSLRVHVYSAEQRQSMLREMSRDREREGKAHSGGGGTGGGAVLALRLAVTSKKAADLFATLHSQGLWARLLIPTPLHGAFIADSSEPGELRGWILKMPPPSSASPSPVPPAEAKAEVKTEATSAAIAAAISDPARFEELSAKLDPDARALMDGLRRKIVTQHGAAPAASPR